MGTAQDCLSVYPEQVELIFIKYYYNNIKINYLYCLFHNKCETVF